jgi:hypothetical protein
LSYVRELIDEGADRSALTLGITELEAWAQQHDVAAFLLA